ncbi:MAG: helix-turn-helix transcriptional regulator [Lachnospiraceae bacterium]|nr:helix-turn-helix transcriptional regulator [Lachnospiraceae bacterium]
MDLAGIGLRIKYCRHAKHLTQEKLAELIDVSPHYIYEIERGTKAMSLYTLNNIAEFLGTSADYLLYGYEQVNHNSDELYELTKNLPPQKRTVLANILSILLQYI